MKAHLQVRTEGAAPANIAIGNTASIGRTSGSTVCLDHNPCVSRQHALIRVQADGRYHLTDLGSRNGTYVDDQRVVFPVVLAPGAIIRIADALITFLPDEGSQPRADFDRTVLSAQASVAGFPTCHVAMLVCDIRGFSEKAERLGVAELAPLLGEWFREAGNCVEQAGGTVDKFIGDALLAYWGTGGQKALACGAALSVAKQLLRLAAARFWPNREQLSIAIALHYGQVMLSNVGLNGERDATILGDAVNIVFRLEGIAKALNQRVVFSEDFCAALPQPPASQDLGVQTLKGRTRAVRVFCLVC